jgi:hypothetical protein
MDLEQLRQKLLATARANPPEDDVPYAFEKRVMANLSAKPALDFRALWARAMWRAAAPCVGLCLMLGAWSFFTGNNSTASESLSQDFEQAMLAVVDQSEEIW